MSTKLYTGYERTNRVKLPDTKTTVDISTTNGAAILGSIARFASQARDPEDIVNAMQLSESIDLIDGTKTANVVVGRRTITEVTDAQGQVHELDDPASVDVYCKNGCTITGTKHIDIMG
jgi:hypothetical protein